MASSDPFGWHKILADSVEEMMRVVDEAESFVYDYVLPAVTELAPPQERAAFLSTVNMPALAQLSPKLYTHLSNDAMNMAQNEREKAAKALDDLEYNNFKADRAFRPQVIPPRVFGMRVGQESATSQAQGLESPLPLGVFR